MDKKLSLLRALKGASLRWAPTLPRKYLTRLERLAMDKKPSLLRVLKGATLRWVPTLLANIRLGSKGSTNTWQIWTNTLA
jgi:hypothetical protein